MPNGVSLYGGGGLWVSNEQALLDGEFRMRQLQKENAELREVHPMARVPRSRNVKAWKRAKKAAIENRLY